DEFLDVYRAVAEGRRGLRRGDIERALQRDVVVRDAHALAAAARRRLDQDREPNFLRDLKRRRRVLDQPVAARHGRYARVPDDLAAPRLVARQRDGLGARADKADMAVAADRREFRILGEKAVPGVYRLRVADFRRGDNARNMQ